MTKRLLRRYAELGVFYEDAGKKLRQSGLCLSWAER